MAYCSQETKAKIVAALKALNLPKTWKYTVAVRDRSTLVVTIRQAPATVLDDFVGHKDSFGNVRELLHGEKKNRLEVFEEEGHLDVNLYHLDAVFTGKTNTIIKRMERAIKDAGEWFDKSDSQTDYFHTAFYIDIQFGRWDKPCTFVGRRRTKSDIAKEVAEQLGVPTVDVKLADVPASDMKGMPFEVSQGGLTVRGTGDAAAAAAHVQQVLDSLPKPEEILAPRDNNVVHIFPATKGVGAISQETQQQMLRASTVRYMVDAMKTTSVGASLNDAALVTLAEAVVDSMDKGN